MKDDSSLVADALNGDGAAFAELYERYFDRVYDFLARMVRDQQEAADLAQDTFLRAMNNLSSLGKAASFKSWLFTIARNTALNRLERASRLQPLEKRNDEDEEYNFDVVDGSRFADPEAAAEAEGYAALVWQAAAALEPNQYSILHLTARDGLDSAEIAQVLGITPNNAYVRVNRMKKALEEAIGALVLWRDGRRFCAELNAALDRFEQAEMSPELRRLIDKHAARCDICSERRRKLASPFAIFGGLALVPPLPGVKESILGELQAAFAQTWGAGAAASGSDASGGAGAHESTQSGDAFSYSAGGAGRHGGGGQPPSSTAAGRGEGEDGTGGRGGLLLKAAGVALVAMLVIGGSIMALARGGDGDGIALALVSPSPPNATVAATSTRLASSTPMSTAALTATATAVETSTPEPQPAAPGAPAQGLAPGGDSGNDGSTAGTGGNGGPPAGGNGNGGPPEGGGGNGDAPPADPEPPLGDPSDPPDAPPPGDGPGVLPPDSDPDPPQSDPPMREPNPCQPFLAAGASSLSFDSKTLVQTVPLSAVGCGSDVEYTASAGQSWVGAIPASGVVPDGGTVPLTIEVRPGGLRPGEYVTQVQVVSSSGSLQIEVILLVPREPTPTPTQPSFTLKPTSTPTPKGPGFITP